MQHLTSISSLALTRIGTSLGRPGAAAAAPLGLPTGPAHAWRPARPPSATDPLNISLRSRPPLRPIAAPCCSAASYGDARGLQALFCGAAIFAGQWVEASVFPISSALAALTLAQ